MADARGDHALMQIVQRMVPDANAATGGHGFAGHDLRQRAAVFVAGGGDGDAAARRQGGGDVFEHGIAVGVAHGHAVQHHVTVQTRQAVGLAIELVFVDHARRGKPFGDGFPAQLHVLRLVVVVQQFLPRAGQVLVGGQRRDQRAQADLTLNDQIAADREEKERGQLGDEVVEKLHEEFLLVDVKADLVEPPQTVGDHSHPVTPAAVHPQRRRTGRAFADLGRQRTHLHHTFLVQQVDAPLQFGDQPCLQGDQRTGGKAEGDRLGKQEPQNRQHLPRLQHRLRQRVAHQPAHRLAFRGDHADQLALRGTFEIGLGEPQDARDQAIAVTPQHAFGQHALHGVDAHLHQPVGDHRQQEQSAQDQQEMDLRECHAVKFDHIRLGGVGVVDDTLGQFQRQVQHRKQRQGDQQQNELVALGVLENKAENVAFYGTVQTLSWGLGRVRCPCVQSRQPSKRYMAWAMGIGAD